MAENLDVPSSLSDFLTTSDTTSLHTPQNREPTRAISYATFVQRKWAHFSEKHFCALIPSLRKTDIVKEIIDSGVFIHLRREFRKRMMVSSKHPYTKRVFSSMSELKSEETRHLVKYYWMIHPFSVAALYYSFFMLAVYLYTLVYILPVNWIYVRHYTIIKWHSFFFDMIITAAIIMTFFLGYLDQDLMYVQMNQWSVAKTYLRTYFFFDIMSCLSSYLIYFFLTASGPSPLNLIKYTMVGRLARFRTMDEALDVFRLYFGFSAVAYVSMQILMRTYLTILLCLGVSSFFQQLPYSSQFVTELEDDAMAMDLTFNTVSEMFGVGRVPNFEKYGETVQSVLFPTLAMLLHFWIIAKLYTLWQRILVASQIGEDHIQQIGSYLEYKGLPLQTRDEIYCYFDFTYQKKFYNESTILNIMSLNLRKEIPNYKLSSSVAKVKFFKALPNNVLMTVIANMEVTYYCPGDDIFRAKTVSKTFYYIKFGTVALFDAKGDEICHLEDNSYYGDISVVFKQVHQETMLAISPCEICKLEQRVLLNILEAFPTLKEKVYEVTRQLLLNRKQDWVSSSYKSRHTVSISFPNAAINN